MSAFTEQMKRNSELVRAQGFVLVEGKVNAMRASAVCGLAN